MKLMIANIQKVLGVSSKIILTLAVIFTVINVFLYLMGKDQPKVTTNPIKENQKKIYEVINNPAYQVTKKDKQIMSVYKTSMCIVMGEACTNNPKDSNKYYSKSVFGVMASAITFPYANPPASGIYWVKNGLRQAGFIPKTYASEGVGFAALKPLSKLWELFRNLAYMLVVIVLVIVGFMIMFRVKINPQTMVNIENSLPRIVLTLILITFSFAIGGFLIDLMYVVSGIGISLIAHNGIYNFSPDIQAQIIQGGGLSKLYDLILGNDDLYGIGGSIMSLLPITINVILRTAVAGVTLWLLNAIPPIKGYCLEGKAGDAATFGGPIGLLVSLSCIAVIFPLIFLFSPLILSVIIVVGTGLFIFFRIFFLLFVAYLRILFAILFSPIILLMNAIPGRNAAMQWIKGLAADLVVFPTVLVLTGLSTIIINIPATTGNFWTPPFLYSVDPTAFNIIVGVSLLFMIPDIVKNMRKLFGIKEAPLKMGLGVLFGGVAGATGTGSALTTKLTGLHYSKQGWEVLKGGFEKVKGAVSKGNP